MTDTNDKPRRKAPYVDFAGDPIYAGDRLITKNGLFFDVDYHPYWADGTLRPEYAAWRAVYVRPVNGVLDLPLAQQIGETIQATVISKVYGGARAGGKATKGMRDVLFERNRQQEEEGFGEDHDDCYGDGQLAFAGATYAINAAENISYGNDSSNEPKAAAPELWPWPNRWWKPTTVRRDLVKAAALIIAEIDRLDREAEKEKSE